MIAGAMIGLTLGVFIADAMLPNGASPWWRFTTAIFCTAVGIEALLDHDRTSALAAFTIAAGHLLPTILVAVHRRRQTSAAKGSASS